MQKRLRDKINWALFDSTQVDPKLLQLAKGACLVEYNSEDYVNYLRNVFRGDELICESLEQWGNEEREHGETLAKWVQLCDPSFDFQKSLSRFNSIYAIDTDVAESTRGSKALELVARCLVETGTSTYYTALADSSTEPVLAQICRLISAEEIRHYTLFLKNLKRYQDIEKLSIAARVKMAILRAVESQDEELSSAYACGNYADHDLNPPFLAQTSREFLALGYNLYRPKHLKMVVKLATNATGLPSPAWLISSITHLLSLLFGWKRWRTRHDIESRLFVDSIIQAPQINDPI